MRISDEQAVAVQHRVERMEKRFEGENGLHERTKKYIQHFHNAWEVDPFMDGDKVEESKRDFQFAQTQTTKLRNKALDLVGRLTENEWQPSIIPVKQTAAGKADAERAETLFTNGFAQLQKLTGLDIQSSLAQLLTTQAFGVLHWQMDTGVYADGPDYDETDDEPSEAERYTEDDYPETVGRTKAKRYRETEDSMTDRLARYRASKGLPVFVEVLSPRQCYFRLGKYSNRGQFLEFMVKRQIALEDYAEEVNERNKLSDERDSPVEHQQGTEDTWQPSADDWGTTATLTQLWDKDCCYEICEYGDGKERIEKFPHPYKRPPFALALGDYWHGTDPVFMYEPALAGMYRHKAQYDRAMSLFHALAEFAAIRRYMLEDKGNQPARLREDGDNAIDMNANTSMAGEVPPGKELKAIGGDAKLNDFGAALALIAEEMEEAAPGTGRAQFGASTQPWAARIEQAQENIQPKMYLRNIANCIAEMLQNLCEVFALPVEDGGPGEVFSWGSGQDGTLDRSKTISLKTEGWEGLIAEVNIDPVSAAERITWEEHLRNLCNDSVIQMSLLEYLEQTGVPNPQETYVERLTNNYVHANVVPGLLKQGAAQYLGLPTVNVLGTDGQIVGPMGELVSPAQHLQQMQQQQIGRMGNFRPQTGSMGTTPGPLAGAPAMPGAAPMAGMVG